MAMADPKRAARARGGADGGAPRARPAPVAAQKQARSAFALRPSPPERGRPPAEGQVVEGYDVLADLDRVIAGDADDACRARLGAWHEEWHEARIKARIKARIDYDIRVGIPRDMVRAYALPPVPDLP